MLYCYTVSTPVFFSPTLLTPFTPLSSSPPLDMGLILPQTVQILPLVHESGVPLLWLLKHLFLV